MPKSVDANQPEIVAALREVGREVAGGVSPSVVKLVREAIDHVAIIQEIVEVFHVIDEEADRDIIREKADKALRSLLTVDTILSEEGVPRGTCPRHCTGLSSTVRSVQGTEHNVENS